ncbi:MAG: hypothetical protein O3C43_09470 [Verrucomicrobia bacterium]|nr:hypothetical protein [Verrucomicrobiota bacterium]MDA1066718.1 hypothetical protein [Verrucomicrobiota bacterium]
MKSFTKFKDRLFGVVVVLFASSVFSFAQSAEIEWKDPAITVDESSGTVDVTLLRSGSLTGLASIFYQTVAGTATSGFDYQSINNRQALFTGGKEELTVSIRINQDFQKEGPETFLLQLFNPNTGTIIGSNKDLTITIQDDDVATIEWSEGVVRVGEDASSVELIATRSGGTGFSASVDYNTTGGTASPVFDFQSKSGTLNFLAGEVQKSVFINITNDTQSESDEEFTVQLSDPNSAELGSQGQVRVIIEDDESSPGTIGWNVSSIQKSEGGLEVELVAQRTGGSLGSVSVQYATSDGSAANGTDYIGSSGFLNWGAGSTTPRSVTITILEDQMDESDETFNLILSNLVGDADLGQSTAIITIQDNDEISSAGTVGFTTGILTVEESVGVAFVSVSRIGGSSGELEVSYSFTDSTAVRGSDFTGVDGVLQWSDGDVQNKFISFPIIDDGVFESDESFVISLAASIPEILNESSAINVVIEDDDVASQGTVVFASSIQSIPESAGTLNVAVQRIGGATGAVSVSYQTIEGVAMASIDFVNQVGELNWADGDGADKFIVLTILDDLLFEGNESFSIQLSDIGDGSVAGENSIQTITISDDEAEPGTWFEFNRTLYSGTEGSGLVEILVERFGDGVGQASVQVRSENADAIAGVDYTQLSVVLNWADGDVEPKTANLVLLNDFSSELNERVSLLLSDPSENALVGDVVEAQALIYDDDTNSGELLNLSTRGYVGFNDEVLIGGFIIFNGPLRVLIRAVGPSLVTVPGFLQDPSLQIINNADQSLVDENDDWLDNFTQIQPIIDTGLGNLNARESALLLTLPAGSYSAIVSTNGPPGIGSIEIYVDQSAGLSGDLVNISTRSLVGTDDKRVIGGFVILGSKPKQVLIRGIGPSMAAAGVNNVLGDLMLELFSGATKMTENNDWQSADNAGMVSSLLPPANAKESALLITLDPGGYTAILSGASGSTGIGLIEIYEVTE